ncbi:acetolactate synthase, large chain related protein [Thermoplasma acidophilum]|uniref:Acetolactate synthase, large chain related protein n=1 Tax=Thermoplasma acidophilum (strain ATCC 25905 / DSM 1728 / JCM 9062 / NBRC 15155 / AMRC-C165) TaxID=273075 RepID=Q9HKB0_THEAC|nr:thiamine pyrophosphate-binding protein [Thermoplasma acidophilum]CAC11829.1 acetolactate synthase, large chain related protein [Thermoplasma acidophilum]
MASEKDIKSGADIIAEYLERNGVEYVFTLTGHTILSLYEAIRKTKIKLVAVRHEQIAAHAADGYFRASHKPGVVITHIGPGLLNATTGVATAALDSSPLIVISGDAPSVYEGAGPHQEINQVTDLSQYLVYVPFAKRAWRINHVENIERIMDRAFSIALDGRPGVSLVDVPMDIFALKTDKYGLFTAKHSLNESRFAPDRETIRKAVDFILQHEKILILAGGGVRLSEAGKEIEELSELLNAPVATTMGGKGTFPEHNERSLGFLGGWGNPYANKASLESDLIIAVGTRFGEVNSSSWIEGYTFDFSKTDLLRIDIDEKERSKDYPEDMFLQGDAKATVSEIIDELKHRSHVRSGKNSGWYSEFRKGLDGYYDDFMRCEMGSGRIKPNYVIRVLQELIDEDRSISLITDVGWSKNGIAQYFRIDDPLNFITPGGLAINSHLTPQQKWIAEQFVMFFTGPSGEKQWVSKGLALPSRTAILDSSWYKTNFPIQSFAGEQFPHAYGWNYNTTNFQATESAAHSIIVDLFAGKITPTQAYDQIINETNANLKGTSTL